ncbi:M48 family metalloprotease [Sphingomonas sp. SUN019]|uniref:M48 family metalloprotease n=1 Tax=Sphingomonas sp. SUN019 TaxID=2937788 RepID=UPI00216410D8|nr:M48 family metalloprotease [Sphingomonas sp. SUN019]UVO49049.1 M48 family metalloprotease [Sphingomonas sp. SUN019]
MKSLRYLLIAPLITAAAPVGLGVSDLEALRGIDLRLATIAHRLVLANAPLCRDTSPATGVVLHALSQYDEATQGAARKAFGFATPVAVEAVVAGSAADRAGVRPDDGVSAIEGKPLTQTAGTSSADRDAALAALVAASSPVRMILARGGQRRDVAVAAPAGCRAAFEVLLGPQMTAQSDGRVVQIGVRFFERYRDDETAVIVAHELAHVILRHRERLEAAGVKGGLLSELGRNGRLNRLVEDQADRLGLTLLYNAGYDPASAARFWAAHGGDIDGGLFRSRTHPATKARIAALQAEAAAIPAETRPYVPPILAVRDQPLD